MTKDEYRSSSSKADKEEIGMKMKLMQNNDYRGRSSKEGDACKWSNKEGERVRRLAWLRCNRQHIFIKLVSIR